MLRSLGLSSDPGAPLKSFASVLPDHLQPLWRMDEKGAKHVLEHKEGSHCSWDTFFKPSLPTVPSGLTGEGKTQPLDSSWEALGTRWSGGLGRLSYGRSGSWGTSIQPVCPPIPKLSRICLLQSGSLLYLFKAWRKRRDQMGVRGLSLGPPVQGLRVAVAQ